MRRPVVLLLVLALGLLAVAGGYAGYWFYFAGRLRQGVLDWAEARRVEGYTAGWDRVEIGGFPLAFRVRVDQPVLGAPPQALPWELRLPELVGEARPWAPDKWHLVGAAGGRLRLAPSEVRSAIEVSFATLDGDIGPAAPGAEAAGTDVALNGREVVVQADERLRAEEASLRLLVPARAPAGHRDLWSRGTLRLARLHLPAPIAPLGALIEQVEATLAVNGAIPAGALPKALAAWRDAGGTAELERLRLFWGPLSATAEGTLALDEAMQPMAALTATLRGYGEVVDALVGEGRLRPGDAMLAKVGLGLLARPGPDGASQLQAPVTIQNSVLTVAQFRVIRLPRFTWE